MTVYNINLGIGWASSGVEYAQVYRAQIFRKLKIKAKFIFTEMFQSENLQHFTNNIGFEDDEIIWLYGYFTDIKIAASTYPLEKILETFSSPIKHIEKGKGINRYHFEDPSYYVNVSLAGNEGQFVQRVEFVVNGQLTRKDYYSYCKVFSEYYVPKDNKPSLCQRSFYNENGQVAYEEVCQNDKSIFHFPNRICGSKDELMIYFLEKLSLRENDLILLDRATHIGQAVVQYHYPAKLAVVIHAEHFSLKSTTEQHILWNNYYEYQFSHADKIDAFIVSTDRQNEVLSEQFKTYTNFSPRIVSIPVGSLDKKRYSENRKHFYAMTSSRLASEKHIDWLVEAVILAHKSLPDLHFDIYGEGGTRNKLTDMIEKAGAQSYISLKGHQNLKEIYKDYDLYLTASTSEGFGLTLMEAIGSGLPLIGLDVPYGNQTFISHGENGYLISRNEPDDNKQNARLFSQAIIDFYCKMDRSKAQEKSYEIADSYLYEHLCDCWQVFVKELENDNTI